MKSERQELWHTQLTVCMYIVDRAGSLWLQVYTNVCVYVCVCVCVCAGVYMYEYTLNCGF